MKITTKFMLALAMVGSLVLTSCKDYDEDNYNNALISSTLITDGLQKQIDELKNAIESGAIGSCKCDATMKEDILAAAQALIDKAMDDIKSGDVLEQAQTIKDMNKTIAEVNTLAENDSAVVCKMLGVGTLKEAMDKLASGEIMGYNKFKQFVDTKADSARIYKALADSCASMLTQITTVAKQVQKNKDSIAILDGNIKAVEEAYKKADEVLGKRIDSLVGVVDSLGLCIDSLKDARAKQVTGIIVQQVYNPAFGSVNGLFTNVQSNLLMVYAGLAAAPTKFPMAVSGVAIEKIKVAGALVNDSNKIYLTINPNDVDFTNFKGLKLVNSQDKESVLVIDSLVKSDEVLKAGWTRSANNGFYEANVTFPEAVKNNQTALAAAVQSMTFPLDKKALASAAKGLVQNHNGASVKEMASQLLKTVENVNDIEALGVKCPWKDLYGEHAVYSNYNMAAVSAQPLGFTALDGISTDQYFNKAKNLINKTYKRVTDKVINEINKQISDYKDKLSLRGVVKVEAASDGAIVTLNYTGSDAVKDAIDQAVAKGYGELISHDPVKKHLVVKYNFVQVTNLTVDGSDVKVDINAVDGIVNVVTMNDVANLSDMANKLIKTVEDYEAKLQSTKITDKIISYVDKVKNVFDKAKDQILKPQLFINSNKGFALAGIAGAPSVATGTVELVPTTMTLGIVTPIYKKYVRVKDASNNVILEKIYDGASKEGRGIALSGLVKGQKYTVDYSALDFEGKEVANTYAFIYE